MKKENNHNVAMMCYSYIATNHAECITEPIDNSTIAIWRAAMSANTVMGWSEVVLGYGQCMGEAIMEWMVSVEMYDQCAVLRDVLNGSKRYTEEPVNE